MKRLLLCFVLLCVVSMGIAHANPCPSPPDYVPINTRLQTERGLLFRLEHCKYAASHIFGTMHLDDPATQAVAQRAYTAAGNADVALFELLFTQEVMNSIAYDVLLPESAKGLLERLGERDFNYLLSLAQRHQPLMTAPLLNRQQPWAVAVLLQTPEKTGGGSGAPLDILLQQHAQSLKVPTQGLELVREQMSLFRRIPEKSQYDMLRDAMQNYAKNQQTASQMVRYYHEQDLGGLYRVGMESLGASADPKLRQHMQHAMLDARNERMFKRLTRYLGSKRLFIAVGALHLPGQGGLLERLEAAGYQVYPVEE